MQAQELVRTEGWSGGDLQSALTQAPLPPPPPRGLQWGCSCMLNPKSAATPRAIVYFSCLRGSLGTRRSERRRCKFKGPRIRLTTQFASIETMDAAHSSGCSIDMSAGNTRRVHRVKAHQGKAEPNKSVAAAQVYLRMDEMLLREGVRSELEVLAADRGGPSSGSRCRRRRRRCCRPHTRTCTADARPAGALRMQHQKCLEACVR